MGKVGFPVFGVARCQCRVVNYQQVFRVLALGGFGKIKTAGQDFMAVNHHDFVVGDVVPGINERRDVGV